MLAILGRILAFIVGNIKALWTLFGFWRKYKRVKKFFETPPKVVSVEAVLFFSDRCDYKKPVRKKK